MSAVPPSENISPTLPTTLDKGKRGGRNPILSTPVGEALHGCVITEEDHAIEALIIGRNMGAIANEKLGDHQTASLWTQLMMVAIRSRRPEVVKAWEEEERIRLDEGLDYFNSPASHGGRA